MAKMRLVTAASSGMVTLTEKVGPVVVAKTSPLSWFHRISTAAPDPLEVNWLPLTVTSEPGGPLWGLREMLAFGEQAQAIAPPATIVAIRLSSTAPMRRAVTLIELTEVK